MSKVLEAKNISKQYRLGQVGTGTLSHDLKRMWYAMRGKEDPFLKIGEKNDRNVASKSNYVWALKDINFEINRGDVVGIIGKNGAGKSTLLKILSQVTSPSTGDLKIKGRIAALLEVGTGFHPDLTGRENIFLNGAILGMQKSEIKSKFDQIVDFSGCVKYIDTPVKRYSSGMMVRLGFAVAAHLDPDILIVDEVLAVGDAEFQEKCLGKMKDISGEGRTILFVSHNMASMKALCKKGFLMEHGQLSFQGTMNETIERYLASKTKVTGEAEIPAGSSSINSGQVRFTKFFIQNTKGENTDTISYLSPLKLYFEAETQEELHDVILDIRINTIDGIELVHAMNKYSSNEKTSLKKGSNKIECLLTNQLQPGNYSLTIGIHRTNGATLEYVENIRDINISNIAENEKDGFVYDFNLGYVRFESQWKILN